LKKINPTAIEVRILMTKYFFPIFFLVLATKAYSQRDPINNRDIYSTSLKINFSGLRIGIEQKILPRTTIQLEGLYLGGSYAKINPQIRYYPKFFKRRLSYFGIGYFYKHQEYNVTDSVRITGTVPYHSKKFYISKYIHAITLNYGYLYDDKIFKHIVHFEFNLGLGIRSKKSNRYGILPNEEIDYREAFIMRPQYEQDTKGKFAKYPELNLMLTLVLPLKK